MQPGERITLIKKIAGRLASADLEEIRLTLRQFGFQIAWIFPDEDTIDPFLSVVRAIEDAPDNSLLQLHGHLFGDSAPTPPPPGDQQVGSEIWKSGMLRLFVSHTHPYQVQVGQLRDSLARRGVSAFVAHADINPTQQWQDVIESALETCDALAAFLTSDFTTSKWTDQEVGFCIGRAILIIPIRAGADPHGFIGKYQALHGAGKLPDTLADELVDILIAHPLTATRMVNPVVATFNSSGTYDRARANYARLRRIPDSAWTEHLMERVEQALLENNQLTHATVETEAGWRRLPEVVAETFTRVRSQSATTASSTA